MTNSANGPLSKEQNVNFGGYCLIDHGRKRIVRLARSEKPAPLSFVARAYFRMTRVLDIRTVPARWRLAPALLAMLFGCFCVQASQAAPQEATPEARQCKVIKGLIIRARFADIARPVPPKFLETRFFDKLNRYVQHVSYGKFCIGGDVTKRSYKLPNRLSRYRISDRNLKVDPRRTEKLVIETVNMAANDYRIADYDFLAIVMEAKTAEYGMVGLCAYPSHGENYNERINRGTHNRIPYKSGVAVFSYQAPLGTLFHDISHILAGRDKNGKRVLPHLYDNDLQSRPGPPLEVFRKSQVNAGYWDPLSCHHIRRGVSPPGLLAWTKLKLGWIDPAKLRIVRPGETARIVLGPLENGASDVLVVRIPITKDTYYLVENRQHIGADRILPAEGVLITFADDRVHRAVGGKAPAKLMNANPKIPDLNGAAFDIGGNESFADARNGIKIKLLKKIDRSYEIEIAPYAKN